MVLAGQRIQPERFTILPRTLIFLLRDDQILLMQLGHDRSAWSGKLNGLGGHIEAGEDPISSARREVMEETGLQPTDLWLSGVVLIDPGSKPGIGLFIFTGSAPEVDLLPGKEGEPVWIPIDQLEECPLVSDLPILIPAALKSTKTREPFFAVTNFDGDGNPVIRFSDER
jgi:8-oxo-dGTP diphosphatase